MSNRLPDRVDPWQLCAKGQVLEGRLALRELRRLAPLLASEEGEAAFALGFSKDDERRAVIRGRVTAELALVCQRCLEPMALGVAAEVGLALTRGLDEAARLPDDLDPLLVGDDGLDPRDLLEDELILAVPVTPRHRRDECSMPGGVADEAPRAEPAERENPFAVLSALKKGDATGND
jgi:uncharacterized protein